MATGTKKLIINMWVKTIDSGKNYCKLQNVSIAKEIHTFKTPGDENKHSYWLYLADGP